MKVALTDVEQLTGDFHFLRGIFEQLVASINQALNPGGDGSQALLSDGAYGDMDVRQWNGVDVIAPNVAGRPVVDLTHWNGQAVTAGAFTVRASSSQHGTDTTAGTSGTISIASVTTARTSLATSSTDTVGSGTGGIKAAYVSAATTLAWNANSDHANRLNHSVSELL